MNIAFILSMPNVGSWNGKWSGENSVYAIVKSVSGKKRIAKLQSLVGSYSYNFGDGWRAAIAVQIVDAKEARQIRRISSGFCGYEWMVDSIISDGAIYGPTQPKPEAVPA